MTRPVGLRCTEPGRPPGPQPGRTGRGPGRGQPLGVPGAARRAHRTGAPGHPDLPPHTRLDGPDGGHRRRRLRWPVPARTGHRSPGDHGWLARHTSGPAAGRTDHQSCHRDRTWPSATGWSSRWTGRRAIGSPWSAHRPAAERPRCRGLRTPTARSTSTGRRCTTSSTTRSARTSNGHRARCWPTRASRARSPDRGTYRAVFVGRTNSGARRSVAADMSPAPRPSEDWAGISVPRPVPDRSEPPDE